MTDTTDRIRSTDLTAPQGPGVDPLQLITPEVRAAYDRDGVVMLEQAFHPEWL